MTREEAIAIISRPFDMSGVPSDILNAHKMAVEALEQEPCGDTVSRQAILDLCHNHINGTVDANDIARLPAVTPAERATYRKKAKRWKNKYMKLKSEIAKTSPCDLCKYSPPSAGDNKPCTMCPAERSDKE